MASKKLNDQMLPHFFDPKRIGESLNEVSNDLLKTSRHDVTSRWYAGYKETEFFTWEGPGGALIKFQLSFSGQILEWNIINGVQTGVVIQEEFEKTGITPSEMIQFDTKLHGLTLENAKQLIANILVLAPKRREEILKIIDNNTTIDSMSHERLAQKFSDLDIIYSKNKSLLAFRILKKRIALFLKKIVSKK